jgi:hypothetical protein
MRMRLGQQVREVGAAHPRGISCSGFFAVCSDPRLAFDERPLERLLAAVDVDALAVLARRVEERADDARRQVALAQLDRAPSRSRKASRRCAIISSRIVPEPRHDTSSASACGMPSTGPDAVRRVVHRRQTGPVAGPAVHVLLMARLQELQLAELALLQQLLAGTGTRASTRRSPSSCTSETGTFAELDDAAAVVDARRHRHRAGDVLARLQRRIVMRRVVGDRRVDVHEVDVGVAQQRRRSRVALLDAERVADRIERPSSRWQIAYIFAFGWRW